MTTASPTRARSPTPITVGLWLEWAADAPEPLAGDERIRHARGLVIGLDAIPAVQAILLPCPPAEVEALSGLFGDAARPGRLLSDKLRVVTAGRDPAVRRRLIAWAERRRDRGRDRLLGLGATPSPRSWRAALARLADDPTRRTFAVPRRIIKLAKLTLGLKVDEAILAAARALPDAYVGVVTDLRRRGLRATWIILPGATTCARRLPGPKLLECGAGLAPSAGARPELTGLARSAVAVAAPSQYAADLVAGAVAGRPVRVIRPAPLPVCLEDSSAGESRRQLGDDLRSLFGGSPQRPVHRHFCDFPFERIEYLLAAAPSATPGALLPAYATLLRRHRRNLKLLVDGRLPRGHGVFDEVESLGLPFDVAQCAGLGEAARARLLRHAQAVVVADVEAPCLPSIFCEAVAAGTPVVMGRLAAAREVLSPGAFSAAALFDPAGGTTDLVRALLHVLDNRAAVLDRQQSIVAGLSKRRWADVLGDTLGLGRQP